MNRKSVWITAVTIVGITMAIAFYSVGGPKGIAKDPTTSLSVLAFAALIAVPAAWISSRRMRETPAPNVGAMAPQGESRSSFAAFAADTADLPYRVNFHGQDLVLIVLGYGAGLVGLAIGAVLEIGPRHADPGAVLFGLAAMLGAAGCAYRLWLLRTPWLLLYPDRLEKRELTGWRSITRADIEGVRAAGSDRQGAFFEVVPSRPDASGIRLRQKLRDSDAVVGRWFRGVRDLTAEAIAADKSAVLTDPRYGATEADRVKRLGYAKTVATVFNLTSIAVAAWFYFFPTPHIAALAAALAAPALGGLVVRASNGLIVWWSGTRARPAIIFALAPAAAASFWAALNLHLINDRPLIVAVGVVALAAGAFAFQRTTSARRLNMVISTVMAVGFCAFGLTALTDVALDRSSAQVFPLTVTDKNITGSRSRYYNLYVGPWSDQPGGAVSVPSDFYDATTVGTEVCFLRRRGMLGIEWFEVERCPAASAPLPDLAPYTAPFGQPQ